MVNRDDLVFGDIANLSDETGTGIRAFRRAHWLRGQPQLSASAGFAAHKDYCQMDCVMVNRADLGGRFGSREAGSRRRRVRRRRERMRMALAKAKPRSLVVARLQVCAAIGLGFAICTKTS